MQFTRRSGKWLAGIALAFTLFCFTNCTGQFSTLDETAGFSSASSSGLSTPENGQPPAVPPASGASQIPLATLQATCIDALGKPKINSIGMSEITVKSALGFQNSGDVGSGKISLETDSGIKNPSVFNDGVYNCQSRSNLNVRCEVVKGDASKPITLTQAINALGQNVIQAGADVEKIVDRIIRLDDCKKGLQLSLQTQTLVDGIRSSANDPEGYRCANGSFWLKITIDSGVTGVDDKSNLRVSEPSYLKVNVQDNCWKQSRLIADSSIPANVGYGNQVAIDGDWAAALAPTENAMGIRESGAAYMYQRTSGAWAFKQKINVSGANASDTLSSVALKGETLVLGSAYREGTGGVYLFKLSGSSWSQVGAAVRSSDAQAGEDFGFSLSLSADQTSLAVGAPLSVVDGKAKSGAVYIYQVASSGLVAQSKLVAPGDTTFPGFGTSLALDGTTLAVGAPQARTKEALGSGHVYIFQNNVLVKTVTASDKMIPTAGSRFGASVALSGKKLAVGAPGTKLGENANQGRVFYFADWTANETKTFDGSGAQENYGHAVALSASGILMSAPLKDASAGLLDFYSFSSFARKSVRATNTTPNNFFGANIAVSGQSVVVGASKKSDPNSSSGACYLFEM